MKGDDEEDDDSTAIGMSRYPCMPSLVALQQMRNRLHLAHVGRKLMKWTAMATGRELRKIAGEMVEVYKGYSEDVANAFMLLARGRYFYPNLNKMVIENVPRYPTEASVKVHATVRNITGCKVLQYNILENGVDAYEHLAIEKGGQAVEEAKKAWLALLKRMILMVELRTSFDMAERSHRGATKKWNVLAKIVIPRTEATMAYIMSELEERAREEFYRMKKILEVKAKGKNKCEHVEPQWTCPFCLKMRRKDEPTDRCYVCGQLLHKVKPADDDDKKTLIEYRDNIEKIVDMTKIVEDRGLVKKISNVKSFLETAEVIIEKLDKEQNKVLEPIPIDVPLDKLCINCTERFKQEVGATEFERMRNKEEAEAKMIHETSFIDDNLEFGTFETEIKQVTRIVRTRNEDGTISEEKKVVRVKREVRFPLKDKGEPNSLEAGKTRSKAPNPILKPVKKEDSGNLVYQASNHSENSSTYNPKTLGFALVKSDITPFCKRNTYHSDILIMKADRYDLKLRECVSLDSCLSCRIYDLMIRNYSLSKRLSEVAIRGSENLLKCFEPDNDTVIIPSNLAINDKQSKDYIASKNYDALNSNENIFASTSDFNN